MFSYEIKLFSNLNFIKNATPAQYVRHLKSRFQVQVRSSKKRFIQENEGKNLRKLQHGEMREKYFVDIEIDGRIMLKLILKEC